MDLGLLLSGLGSPASASASASASPVAAAAAMNNPCPNHHGGDYSALLQQYLANQQSGVSGNNATSGTLVSYHNNAGSNLAGDLNSPLARSPTTVPGFMPPTTNAYTGAPFHNSFAGATSNNNLMLQHLQQEGNCNFMMKQNALGLQGSAQSSHPQEVNSMGSGDGIMAPWSATSAGLFDRMASISANEIKVKKQRVKPKDRPKRPLSAYNIFFKLERARILEEIPGGGDGDAGTAATGRRNGRKRPHGKIGFENLAKVIGQRWQALLPHEVEIYKAQAMEDMKRYRDQMAEYRAKQEQRMNDKASTTTAANTNESNEVERNDDRNTVEPKY